MPMSPLFGGLLLADILQFGIGVLLGLPASRMAWRRGWWVSAMAAPAVAILAMFAGGLAAGIPCSLLVTALYFTLSGLQRRERQWARVAHLLIGFLDLFWVLNQVDFLRIRLSLKQDPYRIALNIAAIALGLAVFAAFVESLLKGRSRRVAGVLRRDPAVE